MTEEVSPIEDKGKLTPSIGSDGKTVDGGEPVIRAGKSDLIVEREEYWDLIDAWEPKSHKIMMIISALREYYPHLLEILYHDMKTEKITPEIINPWFTMKFTDESGFAGYIGVYLLGKKKTEERIRVLTDIRKKRVMKSLSVKDVKDYYSFRVL